MNEGELSGRLGLRRLAGRRRGGDHRPRLPARRARRHPGCTSATSRRPARSRSSAGPRRRGGTSPPRCARTTCCSPTTCAASYDPIYKVNPPLRTAADVEALREGLADGTIDIVATDHAPHPHEDKDCEWAAAAFGMLGLETALSIVQRDDGRHRPARLGRGRRADVHTPGPDRPGSPTTAGRPRGGRAGQPGALRPRCAPYRRRRRVGVALAQHALRRHGAARPGRRHLPARHGDRARRGEGGSRQ